MFVILIAICVLWRAVLSVSAYSWQLNAAPTQCTDISITVTGTGGQPPYSVLVVPFGSSPFQNKVDVRGVIQKNFDGNSSSVSVPINYPANSQFVAVVSDSVGFGTGGTSTPILVAESDDNTCFDVSQSWSPIFWFFIGSYHQTTRVVQCSTTRIWWNDTANVEGTPSFVGVIPGGLSFPISKESSITTTPEEGVGFSIGFSWLPRIREGTQLVIVGGDNRGLGTGGQASYTIEHSDNSSCVTPGSQGITSGAVELAVKSTVFVCLIPLVALIYIAIFLRAYRRAKQIPKPLNTTTGKVIERYAPLVYLYIFCLSITEVAFSGWILLQYRFNQNYPTVEARTGTAALLFSACWTTIMTGVYAILFIHPMWFSHPISSVGAQALWVFTTWLSWIISSGMINAAVPSSSVVVERTCDGVVYCRQIQWMFALSVVQTLNLTAALGVLAWMAWRSTKDIIQEERVFH